MYCAVEYIYIINLSATDMVGFDKKILLSGLDVRLIIQRKYKMFRTRRTIKEIRRVIACGLSCTLVGKLDKRYL